MASTPDHPSPATADLPKMSPSGSQASHMEPVPSTGKMSEMADFRRMSAVLESLATSQAMVKRVQSSYEAKAENAAPKMRLQDRILYKASPFRRAAYAFVESRFFSTFILIVILMNTVTLILKCFKYISINSGIYMVVLENIFLGIYLTEATMKLIAYKRYYFYTFWNCLDFFIISNNLVEFILPLLLETGDIGSMGILRLFRIFKAIRALRALRVLRTIRFFSSLNVILTTMFESIQSIGSIVALMGVVMYMFSVMGKSLFETYDTIRFGSLWKTFLTLFQILTLDDWFFIYTDNGSDTALFFYLFFYIVIEYFVFLNLFVAVLLDNFQLTLEVSTQERKKTKHAVLMKDMHDSDPEETGDGDGDQSGMMRRLASTYYPHDKEYTRIEKYLQQIASLDQHMYTLQKQEDLINYQLDMCMFEEAQE